MAKTVASGGYVCVVPDLYHRLGTLVLDPQSSDDRVVAIRKIAAASITTSDAMQDTRAVLDWLGTQDQVRASPCGTLGFGRGGSLALQAAATYPDQIRAAASVLGFGYTAESRDTAVALFRTLTAGVYCAFAGRDDIIPASEQDELSYVLAKAHVNAEIVVHPNARHPYIFPDRTVFDREAAHRDWDAIFRLFYRFLGTA
jgi:carboxymethylenebutenolidase